MKAPSQRRRVDVFVVTDYNYTETGIQVSVVQLRVGKLILHYIEFSCFF